MTIQIKTIDPKSCIMLADEVEQFWKSLDIPGPGYVLYRAIFGVLFIFGLRASELCKLTLDDLVLDYATPYLKVRHLKKRGAQKDAVSNKGLPPTLVESIEAWLDIRGTDPGSLFYRWDARKDILNLRAWDRFVLSQLWHRLLKRAGLRPIKLHAIRHTCATYDLIANGGNIRATQVRLGHSKASTTEVYTDILMEQSVEESEGLERIFGMEAEREDTGVVIELPRRVV